MELSDLQTFAAVARVGGITRAAEALNTVQSNVTQRVKALEAEIGTALFERHSRGRTLTGAGRRLLPYALKMAALLPVVVRPLPLRVKPYPIFAYWHEVREADRIHQWFRQRAIGIVCAASAQAGLLDA